MSELKLQLFRDANTGLADGGVIGFALVCGMAGAGQPDAMISTTGLVAALTGSLAYGLSRYSTEKTARRDFDGELNQDEDDQKKSLLANLGLTEEMQDRTLAEIEKDQQQWSSQINESAAHSRSTLYRPAQVAFSMGTGFFVSAMLMCLPYFNLPIKLRPLSLSMIICFSIMLGSGFWKAANSSRNPFAGAVLQLITSVTAGGLAYLVGRLIRD